MSRERLYSVDRIERGSAVLVDDQGNMITVRHDTLPTGASEGSVLRVPLSELGEADWKAATLDEAETARRRAEAAERLKRLRARDPGGDITL